ncbi:universal stress protein [Halovivax limisalsi]|uniref:universal stress protein n=1 Tax=Halovivax limisalsi TaxID=1453760 RepID=UPI001FFC3495|nr:universal stress protein [Halovivax limisalsi]
MVLLIPYDGSALSKTALLHAARSATLYEQTPLAVTVIPDSNAAYARENGWIAEHETFDRATIVSRLREQVAELAPEADFEYIFVDRAAPSGTISNRIREFARERETAAIFIGSENAGHTMLGMDSVGGRVAFEHAADIAIIRNSLPEVEGGGEDG